MKRLLAIAFLVSGTAYGQQAWNTNIVSWDAPTTCENGSSITNCAVTGYQVQRAASQTATTWTTLATVTALTYSHTNAVAGQNCYRVVATSAAGNSQPSNVACKTNVAPSPPSPPTNLRFTDTVVFDLRRIDGRNYLSRHVATVKPTAVPVRRYTVANGSGYCQVLRADVTHVKPSSGVLVAKCA